MWGTEESVSPQQTETASQTPARNSLQVREDEADKTVWATETLAQSYGRVVESLWDSINAATNKLSVLAHVEADEIVLGRWDTVEKLPHGIVLSQSSRPGSALSGAEWRQFVQKMQEEGWRVDNIEFRHNRFDPAHNGSGPALAGGYGAAGPVSHFYFAARLTNPARPQRAMVEGDLDIEWATARSNDVASIKRI